MKRFIIIAVSGSVFLILAMSLLIYFGRGRLVLTIEPNETVVLLDKKEYKVKGGTFSKRLQSGEHTLTVKKEKYETHEEKVDIKNWKTLKRSVKLEATGEKALQAGKSFVAYYNTYSLDKTNEHNEEIKNLITDRFKPYFDSHYLLPSSDKIRANQKSNYSKGTILEGSKILSANDINARVYMKAKIEKLEAGYKPTPISFESTYTLNMVKKDGAWLVDWFVAK